MVFPEMQIHSAAFSLKNEKAFINDLPG